MTPLSGERPTRELDARIAETEPESQEPPADEPGHILTVDPAFIDAEGLVE